MFTRAGLSVMFTVEWGRVMSEKILFNLGAAMALVDGVIDAKGADTKYNRPLYSDCLYVHIDMVWDPEQESYVKDDSGKTPGCIWGHALLGAGVPAGAFEPHEGSDVRQLTDALNDDYLEGVTDLAQAWAFAVQNGQDGGKTWGESRDYANDMLARARKIETTEDEQASWIVRNI